MRILITAVTVSGLNPRRGSYQTQLHMRARE